MAEHITVSCPGCQRSLTVSAQDVGRKARCAHCTQVFTIEAGAASPAPGALAHSPSTGYAHAIAPGIQTLARLTPTAMQHLRVARPWVLFLGIVGFVAVGLMVLSGVGILVVSAKSGGRGGPIVAVISLVYCVGAVINGGLSYLLLAYAGAIRRFLFSQRSTDLEDALGLQTSYWRFVGILAIIGLALSVLFVLVSAVGGFMAASRT